MPRWDVGERCSAKRQQAREEASQVLQFVGRGEISMKIHSGIGNIE